MENLAFFKITETEKGFCLSDWNGTTVQLVDMFYTVLNQDPNIASVIVHAANDFFETIQADKDKLQEFTALYRVLDFKMATRYSKPKGQPSNKADCKEIRQTTKQETDQETKGKSAKHNK